MGLTNRHLTNERLSLRYITVKYVHTKGVTTYPTLRREIATDTSVSEKGLSVGSRGIDTSTKVWWGRKIMAPLLDHVLRGWVMGLPIDGLGIEQPRLGAGQGGGGRRLEGAGTGRDAARRGGGGSERRRRGLGGRECEDGGIEEGGGGEGGGGEADTARPTGRGPVSALVNARSRASITRGELGGGWSRCWSGTWCSGGHGRPSGHSRWSYPDAAPVALERSEGEDTTALFPTLCRGDASDFDRYRIAGYSASGGERGR